MKKIVLILALLSSVSFAANNAVGLWFGDGSNNWGVDVKLLNSNNTAWDIYLGNFEIGDNTAIGMDVGYYFLHNIIKADASVGRFPLHWGPNIGFGWWNGSNYSGFDLGVCLAGGISWFTPTTPKLDVSVELTSPSIGTWTESHKNAYGDWERTWSPAFGLKDKSLGLRVLIHLYFF